jgi:hypothetical protein
MIDQGLGRRRCVAAIILLTMLSSPAAANTSREAIDRVLDAFHQAAARADGDAYFALFSDHAVFLGTDASERWSVAEFRAYALPHFENGNGWTYEPRQRHVDFAPDKQVAWFDELLWNEPFGLCRGSGVLVAGADGWKIAQYNLHFPVPNSLAGKVTEMIRTTAEP